MSNLEKSLSGRDLKPLIVFEKNSNPKGILEDVINKVYPPDQVYKFNSGFKADLIGQIPVENLDSKNYFGAYNNNINKALQSIKELLLKALEYYELSSKEGYYISSEYTDDIRTDVWYDMGGTRIPCFSGIYFIDSDQDSTIKINNETFKTPSGAILLFEAGKKVVYSNNNIKILTFSIAPIPMLEKQYPQKWIPII
jgi:hypothetical protein